MSSLFKGPRRAALLTSIALSTLALPLAIVVVPVTPALAQGASVSVEFRTALAPYGSWHKIARWGSVWVPAHVSRDWRPYTVGHWVYSNDYGWYWDSDAPEASWGLVVYHYGRWIQDPHLGWCWIPGNEWGPSWVSWRRGHDYAGWAPLPPEEVITEYQDQPDYWVFVRTRDLVAPRLTTVILPPRERDVYIHDTVVVNRTVVVSDRRFAVDAGIEPAYVAAAYGRPLPAYQVHPYVLAGTSTFRGAVTLRPDEFRDQARIRQVAGETVARQGTATIQPARSVPRPHALGANERGRLGEHPPRAAQNVGAPGAPQGAGTPTTGSGAMPQQGAQHGRQPGMRPGENANAPANANAPQQSKTTGAGGPQHPNELGRPATMGQGQPGHHRHGISNRANEMNRPGTTGQAPVGSAQHGATTPNENLNHRGAPGPNGHGKEGAQHRKGGLNQTEGAGAPGTSGRGPNAQHGVQERLNRGPLNQQHGRAGEQQRGQIPRTSPQTSGQGPVERNHGIESHGARGGALQEHAPHTNGAGPTSPGPLNRNRGPRGEHGGAMQEHMPHTTGAGPRSLEPRGHEARPGGRGPEGPGPSHLERGPGGPRGEMPHAMTGAGPRGGHETMGAGPRGEHETMGGGPRGGHEPMGAGPRGGHGTMGAGPRGGREGMGAGPRGGGEMMRRGGAPHAMGGMGGAGPAGGER